jgi:hypothetical protein
MDKNRDERYQRGADFASDLHELQGQLHTPGTTTFLKTGSALGTRSQTQTKTQKTGAGLNGPPAVGMAYAAKLARSAFRKAPVRDLILGVATILLLVIVGVQSKLLTGTRDTKQDTKDASQQIQQLRANNPAQPATAAAPLFDGQTQAVSANPATAQTVTAAVVKKTSAKAPAKATAKKNSSAPQPAKEVVIPMSMVEVAVRHTFKDATLTVYVDDTLTLTRPLHGGTQKHLVVFGGVRGMDSETLKVPAGKHVLRFRTQTGDQTVDLSKTISADLIGGDDKTLLITFDKHNTAMHLEWQ